MTVDQSAKNSFGIGGVYKDEPGDEKLSPKQLELKRVCRDFEAVLTGTILKEGLNSAEEMGKISGSADEEDNGCKRMKEVANEQLSLFIGQSGMLGLGNFLFNSMKDKIRQQEVANASKQTKQTEQQ